MKNVNKNLAQLNISVFAIIIGISLVFTLALFDNIKKLEQDSKKLLNIQEVNVLLDALQLIQQEEQLAYQLNYESSEASYQRWTEAKVKTDKLIYTAFFSKDKTPYQPHFAGSYSRLGKHLRGGYYLRIRPGESFLAGGFWEPNKDDLLRMRKEFEMDASEMRKIMSNKKFKSVWEDLVGDELKTAPKGFDKEHENIDLIRKKMYIFTRKFTDKEVTSQEFLDTIDDSFKAIRPFFDYMSDVLTTNLNGESLI